MEVLVRTRINAKNIDLKYYSVPPRWIKSHDKNKEKQLIRCKNEITLCPPKEKSFFYRNMKWYKSFIP